MKLRMLAFTTMLVLLWAAAISTSASDQSSGNDSANQEPSPVATAEKSGVVIPEVKFKFDAVVDGTQVQHDFRIKNTSKAPLDIKQVKTG